ncbi:MAG TPA: glycosyltransferase family 1 protein [Gemmatimonadaceae bacterium]|nr:glycosyltransferase family 1 protein [Gemmatimonadaceae bacterium]
MPRAPRRPRILVCTDTYPPQVNGVSVVTALSVQGLVERGWECRVIAPRYPAPAPDQRPALSGPPVDVEAIRSAPFPPYPDLRIAAPAARRIDRVVAEFRPDLVHCATEFVIGRLAQRGARRHGIPIVTSFHTDFGRYTASYGLPWLRPTVTRYLSRFHRRAVRTYTPSEAARRELVGMGVTTGEVWGRGVDLAVFSPTRRTARMRERIGGDGCFTFLYVGRLAAEKSVDVLVRAFARASGMREGAGLRLVIAGTGPVEAALRRAAPPGVMFLGHLGRTTELPELYASADAFAFASLTETLGLVVLEAMASGLPVLAVPAGGVAEHLRDGENGIAVADHDVSRMAKAMLRLADDRALTRKLAEGALRTAALLSWDAELDRLDASYRRVLAV